MRNDHGNNFNLSNLKSLVDEAERAKARDASEKIEREKMNNFTRIVKGVSKKYESKWVNRDDVEQELWVKVLELIDSCGGIENTDENLVATVCYRRAVDYYRYCRRRYEANIRFIEEDERDKSDIRYQNVAYSHLEKAPDVLFFKEVIDIFEKGSKERQYVVIKLVNYGAIDTEYLDEYDRELAQMPDGNNESDILRILGYMSRSPGSWTTKKRLMREVIRDFLED